MAINNCVINCKFLLNNDPFVPQNQFEKYFFEPKGPKKVEKKALLNLCLHCQNYVQVVENHSSVNCLVLNWF